MSNEKKKKRQNIKIVEKKKNKNSRTVHGGCYREVTSQLAFFFLRTYIIYWGHY